MTEQEDKELPLREDIRLLGRMLGDTVREQEGEEVFETDRAHPPQLDRFPPRRRHQARAELEGQLDRLTADETMIVVRAFSYFSHLANIAEDLHHIRRSRAHQISGSAPREGSLAFALDRAATAGIAPAELEQFFADALIVPVLTAHPTEVQRKSMLDSRARDRPAARASATARS